MAKKYPISGGSGARAGFPRTTLSSLDDVSILNPKLDDELIYNGTAWANVSTIGAGIIKVIAIYDPTSGLPAAPAVNDHYIALYTANGWTAKHIYTWNGALWMDTTPVAGMMVYVQELDDVFVYSTANQWSQFPDSWQDPVISIFNNTAALPVAPVNGDRYIAQVTANGWTANYIYEWNSPNWVPTVPVLGMMTFDNAVGAPYLYSGAAWVIFNPLTAHAIGGALHTADTIANIQTKVSDGKLITSAAAEISTIAAKGLPTTADLLLIEDAASVAPQYQKKSVTIANLVPWLYGTGAPPSAAGLRDGTLYIKYTP